MAPLLGARVHPAQAVGRRVDEPQRKARPDDIPWVDDSFTDHELWPEGEGLISLEPDFVDSDGGDFRLADGSPGVDAGPPDQLDPDGTRSDLGAFGGEGGAWSPDEPNHPLSGRPRDSGSETE